MANPRMILVTKLDPETYASLLKKIRWSMFKSFGIGFFTGTAVFGLISLLMGLTK